MLPDRREGNVGTGEPVSQISMITVVQFQPLKREKSPYAAPAAEELRSHPLETDRNLQLQAELLGTLPKMINDDFSIERRYELADYLGVPYWRVDKAQRRLRVKGVLFVESARVGAMMSSEGERIPFYTFTEQRPIVRHIFSDNPRSSSTTAYAADE